MKIYNQAETHPALKIIGGRRYMKNKSSLNIKTCELVPLVVSKITIPVHKPCHHQLTQIQISISLLFLFFLSLTGIMKQWRRQLTMINAVIDSFIQRFSSSKWPITIQAHRSATNKFIDTTDLWSDDSIDNDLSIKLLNSIAMEQTRSTNQTI